MIDLFGPSPCDGACGVTPHAAESGGGPNASGGSGRASQSAQLCQRTTARPHHRTCGARDTAPLLTKGGRKRPSDEGWRLRPARPAAESQQDECHMDAQRQCHGTCDVRPSEGDVAARVPGTGRPAHSTNPCAETFSCGCLGRVCPRPCTDERVSRIACEPGVSLLMGRGAPLTDDPNDCSLSVSTQRHPAARTARSSPAINEPARTPRGDRRTRCTCEPPPSRVDGRLRMPLDARRCAACPSTARACRLPEECFTGDYPPV